MAEIQLIIVFHSDHKRGVHTHIRRYHTAKCNMLFNPFESLLLLLVFITRHLPSCSVKLKINLKRAAYVPSFSDITNVSTLSHSSKTDRSRTPCFTSRSTKTVQSVQHNTFFLLSLSFHLTITADACKHDHVTAIDN